jgi:GAF domain-containing protein
MSNGSTERQGTAAVRRFLLRDDSLQDTLTKLALIATESVPHIDLASITVLRDGKATTPAFTETSALNLDEAQYSSGEGPCLTAMRHHGEEIYVTGSGRWPEFDDAAAEAAVLATLSVALVAGEEPVGGLNIYSRSSDTFDGEACAAAVELAGEVAVAVANAVAYDEVATLARQLAQAMESRATIEQAKGILVAAQRCSPEEAFDILRRASQRENRKLREMAAAIVERAQQLG